MKAFAKKALCLLMMSVMLLSVLVACGGSTGGGGGGGTNDPLPEAEGYKDPKLPKKDYGGHEFTFITREASAYNIKFIESESETGETLPDAIYRRNSLLEEKYNVKIRQMNVADITTEVRTQVMGGTVEFDVILASCARLATMAQEGLLQNLLEIELIGWDNGYWDTNSRDQLMIGDKLYFANCALDIHTIGFGVYFNKKIVEDAGLTSPYEYMEKNEWTIDNWATMVKAVSRDLDNDGAMTEFDLYGTLAEHHNPRMFLYASGVRGTTNDENGYPVVTLMENPDKTVNLYEKLKDVLSDTSVSYCMTCSPVGANGYANKWGYLKYLFTQDHYMFHYTSDDVLTALAEMESDYGIVPFPKYDKNQEKYQTVYPYNNSLLAIPSVSTDLDRTARLLEDMNYFSAITVIPAWYDTLLARRYARDDESEESLDILRENCVYDLGLYYDFGGLRSRIMDVDFRTVNIARSYDAFKKGIDNDIKKIYEDFQKA